MVWIAGTRRPVRKLRPQRPSNVSLALLLLVVSNFPIASAVSNDVPDWAHLLVSQGQVGDAKCNMEVIQTVNNQLLHGLLEEITNTTYFRLFGFTNTMEGCPLNKEEEPCPSEVPEQSSAPFGEPAHGPGSGGLCKLDTGADDSPFGSSSDSPFGGSGSPGSGSAFGSFEKPAVVAKVNMTISSREDTALNAGGAKGVKDCDDDTKPQFWLDMCEKLAPHSTDFVNLQLNPEGYTGYNGTEVWNAIYEQNCFNGENNDGIVVDMCYEERVMYRLLSGLHASTNIHISENFKSPIPGIRDKWEPNPDRFMKQFAPYPERIRNLHFSFVVMLRALHRAAPALYHYRFITGEGVEDDNTQKLVQRLLDSDVLRSCNDVFTAFDESMLFRANDRPSSTISALKQEFKRVFHNISNLINCVTCTKCKLHGRMQLLGIGTALKILLIPPELVASSLERNEIVALVNTIHKFSHAIATAPKLMELYWEQHLGTATPEAITTTFDKSSRNTSKSRTHTPQSLADDDEALDLTVGSIARSAKRGLITEDQEIELLDLALVDERDLLVLGKHYSDDLPRFAQHALRNLLQNGSMVKAQRKGSPDVVIVGGGLGGLTAALTVLDRGGSVVIVEKEPIFGGNSAKASSGINGIDEEGIQLGDSVAKFAEDIVKGSGIPEYVSNPLVMTLAKGSEQALSWLRSRVEIPLELRGQLGGHSLPRTHRPVNGMAGSELVAAVKAKVMEYAKGSSPALKVMLNSKAVELLRDDSQREQTVIVGVKVETADGTKLDVRAPSVILATGGFANDYTDSSLISQHKPEFTKFSTTNGKFATGDGHKLAMAVGADTVDMGNIQLHPTGFVDRRDLDAKVKTLCAEILRGVGAILVDSQGKRFANELGTRDYISNAMLSNAKLNNVAGQPSFGIILNEAAAQKATKHLSTYTRRSLLNRVEGIDGVAKYLKVSPESLEQTIKSYNENQSGNTDEFGKTVFPSQPFADLLNKNQVFYVGEVTPVMHYTMGGVVINEGGKVLSGGSNPREIAGLYAAGEITGGIHGKNRLGGNALTECVVFGFEVGSNVPITTAIRATNLNPTQSNDGTGSDTMKQISMDELSKHTNNGECWVAIDGMVYDFGSFAESHPGGTEAIMELCGLDGHSEFYEVHSKALLDDFIPLGTLLA